MILYLQRLFERVRFVGRLADETRRARDLDVVVNQDTVVHDGHTGRRRQAAVFRKPGRREEDVVRLPFSGRAAGVDLRDVLLVDARRLAVRVGTVFPGIEHLDLVALLDDDAAVAAALPFPFDDRGGPPFHVQLDVPERFPGEDIARAAHDRDRAIRKRPLDVAAVPVLPLVEIGAVEEHDRVGRWRPAGPRGHRDRFGFPDFSIRGIAARGLLGEGKRSQPETQRRAAHPAR